MAQAGFVLLLLPVISSLKGIAFRNLPSYCMDGKPPPPSLANSSSNHADHVRGWNLGNLYWPAYGEKAL